MPSYSDSLTVVVWQHFAETRELVTLEAAAATDAWHTAVDHIRLMQTDQHMNMPMKLGRCAVVQRLDLRSRTKQYGALNVVRQRHAGAACDQNRTIRESSGCKTDPMWVLRTQH